MQEAKAFLIFLVMVQVPFGICLAVAGTAGYVANRLTARFAWIQRLARPVAAVVFTLVLLLQMTGAIVAFGAVANSDARSKASMLARGISEVLTCMLPLLSIPAAIVGGVSLVLLTRRWWPRSSTPTAD